MAEERKTAAEKYAEATNAQAEATGDAAAEVSPAEAMAGVRGALDGLRELFATLKPQSDTVTLHDARGNEHEVSTWLSADAQMELMNQLDVVSDTLNVDRLRAEFREHGVGAVGTALYVAMRDPAILRAVSAAFDAAHPGAVNDARDNLNVEKGGASALFPAEEIAAGLAPFFVRPIARMMEVLADMMPDPYGDQ